MSTFAEGFALFEQEERIIFTPEYRVYYNKETSDVEQSYATVYDTTPPEGDFIVITAEQFKLLRSGAKVINQELQYPAKARVYNLEESKDGYGTAENNKFFIGDHDHYKHKQEYE